MKRFVGILIGAGLLYALAYGVLIDEAGRIGHSLFWRGLAQGRLMDVGFVLKTHTFWILFIATVVGAILGGWIADRIGQGQKKPAGS